MPYIPDDDHRRYQLNPFTDDYTAVPKTEGELNYQITRVIEAYRREGGTKYKTINDILGALDGASKEFYRRVAAPYEDLKIKQNGDVYAPLEDSHENSGRSDAGQEPAGSVARTSDGAGPDRDGVVSVPIERLVERVGVDRRGGIPRVDDWGTPQFRIR